MRLLDGKQVGEFSNLMKKVKGWSIFVRTGESDYYSSDSFEEIQGDELRIAQWKKGAPRPNLYTTKIGFYCSDKHRFSIDGNIVAIEWNWVSNDELHVFIYTSVDPKVTDILSINRYITIFRSPGSKTTSPSG